MKTAIAQTKPKARAPQKKHAKPEQDLISCDEVERVYDGRWVIMDIRKLSRCNQPEAGIVVFSADTEEELFAYGKKLLEANPKRRYYFFYAGDPSLNPNLPAVMLNVTLAN
jgi:hypothetical protein